MENDLYNLIELGVQKFLNGEGKLTQIAKSLKLPSSKCLTKRLEELTLIPEVSVRDSYSVSEVHRQITTKQKYDEEQTHLKDDTKYELPIATTSVLGGIKSGNEANNFVARSGGEGQIENVPNYEAEVVVNPTTGKATVNLEAMAGPETQWSIVAGQTVFGIREVSTDKLVQGTNTLIINGGGAAW